MLKRHYEMQDIANLRRQLAVRFEQDSAAVLKAIRADLSAYSELTPATLGKDPSSMVVLELRVMQAMLAGMKAEEI